MIKTFEQHTYDNYGYYDMSNANNDLLAEELKKLDAGNSIFIEYDKYSNFIKIEVDKNFLDKVIDLIKTQKAEYLGFDDKDIDKNDIVLVSPMASISLQICFFIRCGYIKVIKKYVKQKIVLMPLW